MTGMWVTRGRNVATDERTKPFFFILSAKHRSWKMNNILFKLERQVSSTGSRVKTTDEEDARHGG